MKQFKILQKDGKARSGKLITAHGIIETPNFIPVGTQGSVKALSPRDLKEIGVQIVLANTYHLMLRPGVRVIGEFGGLHKFMGWDGPVMTDSGGFQVFSLGGALEEGSSKVVSGKRAKQESPRPKLNKITDEGVIFQSHLDGSKHFLGPKESIKLQYQLGADLIVVFDDHEYRNDLEHLKKSLELTEKWALQSKVAHDIYVDDRTHLRPLLYGVIHGGTNKELRIRSAKFTDKNFDAIAIGGIYGTKKQMYEMIDYVLPEVSDEKVRHLLGIGEVEDLFNAVERGVDLFDCVAPTRRARNGSLYITSYPFTLNIALSKYTSDKNPIDKECLCYTCQNFSKAYLRHLYLAKEILFHTLATYHNIYFIENLMGQIREAIKSNNFSKLRGSFLASP